MAGRDDKTVFGGPLPTGDKAGDKRPSAWDERTVIGGGFTPTPARETTWMGGAPSSIGSPAGQSQGFFPSAPQPQAQVRQQPTISLQAAMQGAGLGNAASSNPLIAASANLLILLGRLRTGLVEMDAAPLMQHVLSEIDAFERAAIEKGVDRHEGMVAKYALCGTADDIVQNLPGADRGVWIQYSMVARFFHKRDSGVGFFQEAEKAMQAPGQNFNLLELMLTCLYLGFEGQYRTMPNGGVELSRIRNAIHATLRRVAPRPDDDISVMWEPVVMGKRRRFAAIPVWAIGAVAAVLVVGTYATLSTLINRDGAAAAQELYTLHPTHQAVAMERAAGPVFEPEIKTTQLDRIRAALAAEIDAGTVGVGLKGNFIAVSVGDALLFDTGAVEVRDAFLPLAERIAAVLGAEQGPARVVGFTDSVPLSGRGRFKTNIELSEARATSVQAALAERMADPSRLGVEGRGEADPVGDNATPEGRAQNRRVEILIAREGTY